MSKHYEFSYQSKKQRLGVYAAKIATLLLMSNSVYTLGWHTDTLIEKLSAAGGISIWVWVYSNLLFVKLEVKEAFVPPFNIRNGLEFLVIGAILSTINTINTIWNIIELS